MVHIKAVLMDGDGSVLTNDGVFPESMQKLIKSNQQIHWIMATGRSLDLLERTPVIPFLSADLPHVLDGGSRIMKLSREIIREYPISGHELNVLFNQLTEDLIEFMYYYLDDQHRFFYAPDLSIWEGSHPIFNSSKRTNSISGFHKFTEAHPPTKVFIRVKKPISLHGVHWNQNETNIDVTAHGINKGSACLELLKVLKLNPAEVAFVFNDKNDLPVLLHKDLQDITTIKVGSYLPEVTANYHVSSPYEVAEVLGKLL